MLPQGEDDVQSVSLRTRRYGLLLAAIGCATLLGTFAYMPISAADGIAAADEPKSKEPVTAQEDDAAARLEAKWAKLKPVEADEIVRRHLQGLVRAVHAYGEKNGDVLPPAAIPNPAIKPEKRLSGLVLLLPYLGVPPSYAKDERNPQTFFDDNTIKLAKDVFNSIDLKKGWDDPANQRAARTVLPALLGPGCGAFRDGHGYAVSHFAFVRGANGKDNGAFTDEGDVTYGAGKHQISDGTVNTIAIGQIDSEFGPWIAAGPAL